MNCQFILIPIDTYECKLGEKIKEKKTASSIFFHMLFPAIISFVHWNVSWWQEIHHEMYVDFRSKTIFSGSTHYRARVNVQSVHICRLTMKHFITYNQ